MPSDKNEVNSIDVSYNKDKNEVDITDILHSKDAKASKGMKNKLKENVSSKVSYFSLFKYSNISEKIMIFIGIIASIAKGLITPLM